MHRRGILTSWPIRRKLLLLILIIFLPTCGIVVAIGFEHRNHEVEEAKKDALLMVDSLAAQQEQVAVGTKQMLITLAQLPEVQRLDAGACSELFCEICNRHRFYSAIGAVRPNGYVFASSMPFLPNGVNVLEQKHVVDAIRSLDFSAGEYIVDKITQVQSIHYSYPVLGADKKLIAIIVAGFKLDEYSSFIEKANLPSGSAVIISDHKERRLYRFPKNDATPLGKAPKKGFDQLTAEFTEGTYEGMADDGIYRIYAFKRLSLREGSPPYLRIVVGIPKYPFIQKANAEMLHSLLFLAVATVLTMFVAWVFGNLAFVKPIAELVTATQRLGGGEMGTRTGVPHTRDELGKLAKSFDNMASLLEANNLERKNVQDALAESGNVTGIVHVSIDIAERKRTEEALRQSEEKYRMLFEHSPLGIFHFDENGIVTACNENLIRILGSSKEKLVGFDLSTYFHDKEIRDAFSVCMSGNRGHYEGYYSAKTGTCTKPVKCDYAPLFSEDGSISGGMVIVEDISERMQAQEALLESEAQLRFLSSRLLTAQEEERKRIAAEIHDSLGSSLSAVKIALENARGQLKKEGVSTDYFDTPISWIQHTIDEARRLMTDLRPSLLDDMGLLPTTAWFLRQYRTIHSDVNIEDEIRIEESDIPEPLKIVIFRIMQEAFHNISKYSNAEFINLSLIKRNGTIELAIEDNGGGFNVQAALHERSFKKGLGLTSMKERAELLGGTFSIESVQGEGTLIRASWSL